MKKEIRFAVEITLTLAVLLLSFFVLSRHYSKVETYAQDIEYLEEKKSSVLDLAGAATTASVAITLLPDDVATPIAEKITDLSSYFLLIVAAVVLEKYLLTIAGYISFRVLLPAACILFLIYFLGRNENYKSVAIKLSAFALSIAVLIPVSIRISRMIETTYEAVSQSSVEEIVETTQQMTAPEEEGSGEAPASWWQEIWNNARQTAGKLTKGVTAVPKKLSDLLNRFIEAVAVMIITSCAIPILVLLGFLWLIKLFMGLEFRPSAYRFRPRRREEFPHPSGEKES
ncbi:MAG: hypothetical protein KBS46_08205 [Clostridiales bacterium]|nr:hypothetical protein [Candidatus Apopatocola equi]